jgi:predicted transcriptional regulator
VNNIARKQSYYVRVEQLMTGAKKTLIVSQKVRVLLEIFARDFVHLIVFLLKTGVPFQMTLSVDVRWNHYVFQKT